MNFPCKCRRIPERIPNLVDRERLVCALENPGIFIRLCMPPLLADVLIARDQGFTMKKNRLIDGGFFMKKIAATLFLFLGICLQRRHGGRNSDTHAFGQ